MGTCKKCKKCNCTEQILESCLPRMPAYVDFPKHFHTLAAKAILWPYSCGLQHICSETWRWKGEEGSAKLNVEIWIWTLVALNQFLLLLGSSFCSQGCNFPMCPFNDYVFRSKTFQFKSVARSRAWWFTPVGDSHTCKIVYILLNPEGTRNHWPKPTHTLLCALTLWIQPTRME